MDILEDFAVEQFIRNVAGDNAVKLVKSIPDREITDEELAEISGLHLNTVRKLLFTLYERRILKYRRLHDKKTGWITYLWRVNRNTITDMMRLETKKLLDNLKRCLDIEKNNAFYRCKNCNERFVFDVAMEMNFKCPSCKSDLSYYDNSDTIKALEERIVKIENFLSE